MTKFLIVFLSLAPGAFAQTYRWSLGAAGSELVTAGGRSQLALTGDNMRVIASVRFATLKLFPRSVTVARVELSIANLGTKPRKVTPSRVTLVTIGPPSTSLRQFDPRDLNSIIVNSSNPLTSGRIDLEKRKDFEKFADAYLADVLKVQTLDPGDDAKGTVFFYPPTSPGLKSFQASIVIDGAAFEFPLKLEVPKPEPH